jgi:cyclic pyranopterin monophosphate synthase
MSEFSHFNELGEVRMVDVSDKPPTPRTARARARVYLPDGVRALLEEGEIQGPKGPVFQTARIAGIMAAKRTGELIPLCHPIGLDKVELHFNPSGDEVIITSEAKVIARTGVEMEALTAVTIAALTVYDMCKAVSHDIEIRSILLLSKSGGKRDFNRS